MPRAGGEADKFGNRYEAIWTVDSLLDVLTGRALALTVEPLADGLGIEFIKELPNGREYHSLKRQTTSPAWTLSELTASSKSGRTILGDLFNHTARGASGTVCFVSTTTANDLEELRSMAAASFDLANFKQRLVVQGRLKQQFDAHFVKIGANDTERWDFLRRLRVVGITEEELRRRVEQDIRYHLYHPDGTPVDSKATMLLLGDAVLRRLGNRIDQAALLEILSSQKLFEKDWQNDRHIHETVVLRNGIYLGDCEAELIHGERIARQEAIQAVEEINGGSRRYVAIVGAAGLGKSCAVAQIVHSLTSVGKFVLALRLDLQTKALTADALGRELGLPVSPVMVLAGIANGGPCTLVLDQLDALSLASGRNQDLWLVFQELLIEIRRYPNMRVLLACRAFDADHDHRLRKLLADGDDCKRINLAPLSLDEVRAAVSRTPVDPGGLSPAELALLQTPQNLNLFLQGNPVSTEETLSVQVLLDRYWEHKQLRVERRLARASRWQDVMETLTTRLSERQSLSAPVDVLDAFKPEVLAMASEHVLVLDGKSCRFFHESLFDYAFARVYIASGGGSASRLLLDGGDDQHLFRRAQVRQILTYQRDRDFPAYLSDLRTLLIDSRIRIHIKKLVMDWLRSLPAPVTEEWELVKSLHAQPPCSRWWKTVPYGNPGWFDLLLADGTWQAWLGSADGSDVDHALWLLSQKPIMLDRSDQVARLIESFLDGSEIWKKRFRTLLRFAEAYHGRRMFDLFLYSVRAGWFDEPEEGRFDGLYDLPQKSPEHAVELLAELIDRQCRLRPTGNPFENGAPCDALPHGYCAKLATNATPTFVEWILPRVAREISARVHSDIDDNYHDEIWTHLGFGPERNFALQILGCLKSSMRSLAAAEPERLRKAVAPFLECRSFTLGYLMLESWCGNPAEFADETATYLAKHLFRLDIGYAVTGGGEGAAAVSRSAIKAISPFCRPEIYQSLESAILQFHDPYEAKHRELRGRTLFLLLSSLPLQRLSSEAKKQLGELNRKFVG
jgi:hypothetical protein